MSAAYDEIREAAERIRLYFGLTIEGSHIRTDLETIDRAAADLDRAADDAAKIATDAYGRGRDDEAAGLSTEAHAGGGPKVPWEADPAGWNVPTPPARPLCVCSDGFQAVEGPDGSAYCGACGGDPK